MLLEMARPKPDPTPISLVVKKGSNSLPQVLGCDPLAGVTNLRTDLVALLPGSHPDLVVLDVAFGDGVRRVDEQVEEDL